MAKNNKKIDQLEEFEALEEQHLEEVSRRGNYHMDAASELDKQIISIQKSSRVNIQQLSYLHNFLRMKYRWYYKWHQNSYASLIHSMLLILTVLCVSFSFFFTAFHAPTPVRAELASEAPGQLEFDQNNAPSFTLDTKGLIVEHSQTNANGELEVGGKKISAEISSAERNSEIKPKILSLPDNPDHFAIKVDSLNQFTPGKYTLSVALDVPGNFQTITQDFLWGVLAINPDQSLYKLGQTSTIAMGVLDDKGNMVCDAKLEMQISDPDNVAVKVSTADNTIVTSPDCLKKTTGLEPDYYTKLKPTKAGTYKLHLKAETSNGTREADDSFVVEDNPEIVIKREAPTRIYPVNKYTMKLDVSSHINFTGPVREKVPASFDITPEAGLDISVQGDLKVLTWQYDFEAGESKTFAYEFKAPEISPQFFLLGAAEIGPLLDPNGVLSESDHVYRESRRWEIANDATTINISGTCQQLNRSTNCADSEVIKVAINGVLSGTTGTTASGAWSISAISVNGGDILTVFADGVADANEANTVLKVAATPADIAGILLYERHLVVGGATNQTITNADLSQYDNSVSGDEDIFFEVDASSNLLVPQTGTSDSTINQILYVVGSNTYQPASAGGKSITVPYIIIAASGVLTADSNTIHVVGATTPMTISGTFNANTSTFDYDCSTGNVNVAASTYYNLGVGTVSDTAAARTYTAAGAITVSNVLTVGNASSTNTDLFAGSSYILTLSGSGTPFNITAKGGFTYATSTVNYIGSGATTVAGGITYYNLGVGTTSDTAAAVTYTLGGNVTATNLITIGNASSTNKDIFALSNKTLTLKRATSAPITVTTKGTFQADTSTVKFQADAAMSVTALTYYNLNLDPPSITAARAYTAAGAITVSNNLTINATASTAYAMTFTLGGAITVTGTTSIAGTTLGTTVLDTKAANNYAFTTGLMSIAAGGNFNGNNSTVTVNGNFSNAGRFNVLNATTTIAGSFTNSGVYSQAATTSLTKQSDATATITCGTSVFKNLTINASGSTYTLQDDLNVYGDLTLTAGTLDAGSNRTINIAGAWLNNGGTFTPRSGTVSYVDYQSGKTITSNGQSFYNLTINGTNPTFTTSLMHFEGANNGTTFTDENSANTWTVNGGAVVTSTAAKKFGAASFSSGGSSTDYISTTNNLSNFQLTTAPDFTIDAWFYLNESPGLAARMIASEGNGGASWSTTNGHHWTLFTHTDSKLYFQYNSNGGATSLISSTTISGTTWTHVAIVKTGGYLKMYIGGVEKASAVAPTSITLPSGGTPTMNIGNDATTADPWNGYIDEFRMTKGVGLWNAAFTPPAAAYSSDQTLSGATTVTNNLTIAKGLLTVGANNLVLNNMAQTGGTFVASAANTFSVSGNYANSGGTFTDSGGTLTLNGSAAQAVTAGGTGANNDFANLIVTNASSSGVTFNDSNTITGTFTDTVSSASSYLYFHAGSTYAFANININGGSTSTRVVMHSTSNGTPWIFTVSNATPTVSYVDAQDSDASTTPPGINATTGCLNSTGNINWTFTAAQNINLIGTLFTDLAQTVGAANKPLGVSVNGGTVTTGSTDSSGNFSLPVAINNNQMVAIFVKGDSSKGSFIFKVGTISGDITDLQFNVGYAKLNYLAGSEMTNSMLALASASADSDILVSVSSGTATFANGVSMYVKNSKVYRPGGNIVTDGTTIRGTLNLENNSMTVHGSWDATNGIFSCGGSSTVTFDASSTGKTILSNGSHFDNVGFNNASGGWSFSDATILNSNLAMTAGTLSGTSDISVNGGVVTGNGTINLTGGTFLVDGSGNFGGTTNWNFYNLTFGDTSGTATTTKTGSNIPCIYGTLTIAANQILDAGSSYWRLFADGTPFAINGTFIQGTSTFVYAGSTANITGSTYYNLNVNKAGGTLTLAGSTTVQNILNIIAGTLDGSNQTLILSGSGTPFIGSGTFTPSTSTVRYTGTSATNIASVPYYNLQTNSSSPTESLLHFDGINNGTTFTDENSANTWTASGGAVTSTATKEFGTASYYGAGGMTDYLSTSNDLSNFQLADAPDFTIDTWVYLNESTGNFRMIAGDGNGASSWSTTDGHHWVIFLNSSGQIYFQYNQSGGAASLVSNTTLSPWTWTHIAVVKTGGYLKMYMGGADVASVAAPSYITVPSGGTPMMRIAGSASYETTWNGYIDEFRMTKGVGLWSSAFTPPTAPSTIATTYSIGADLIVANNLDETGSIFASGSNNVSIGGSLNISAGSTFNAPAAGKTFNLTSNLNNSGTFNHNSGTVTLNGQGLQTITSGGTSFNNLTITNASSGGVSFADNATTAGTFTDTTASSKLIFHAASTYAFATIDINGHATGTRIVMKSSSDTHPWILNVSQASPSVSYVNVRDSNATSNGISAVVGSLDGTGNTNWTFAGASIAVSGTVYTSENKSSNIGAGKTVALVVNGDTGSSATVETGSGGTFSFSGVILSINNPVLVYLSGESEKGALITQAATTTSDITGLELFTNDIVLTHETTGPLSNTILDAADVADTDSLFAVSGGVPTFTVGYKVLIPTGKTYTPGANVNAGSLNIAGTFSPEGNTVTLADSGSPLQISGTFNEGTSTVVYTGSSATNVTGSTYNNLTVNHAGTTFTSSGNTTVKSEFTIQAGAFDASDDTLTLAGAGTPFVNSDTFTPSTSTVKYTGAGATTLAAANYNNLEAVPASAPAGGGGWIVDGTLSDSSYNGTYAQSGTYGSSNKPAYTNGSKWLFSDYADGPMVDYWCMASTEADLYAPWMQCAYYSGDTNLPGTNWYAGDSYTGTPSLSEAASAYVYTLAAGTFNIGGNYTNGTASVMVETNATTNDPIINVDGNFSNLVGSTFIASDSAAFSVASNFTNNNKFIDSAGTLTLDGQGLQTITVNGTDGDHDFNNLTVTNASTNGVSFADSATVIGTFTDTTASSKVTFHSGSTYAFNAININGQATGTKITLTSSSSGTAWNLNITAASPAASYVSVKDSNANKDIDATTGGYDNTGNTHWLFPVSVYISGTVYTSNNKSTNIGANKTVALSINGGAKITDETDASGIFRFDDVYIGANNSITLFLDGETEKASLVTIAADGTSAISSLEMFTDRIVLTHASAGPISNTVLAIADNACASDCLFSVDASNNATFGTGDEVYIPSSKTYAPGGAVTLDNVKVDGTLTLDSNAITVHGSWDSDSGHFTTSGTVTFDAASGTKTLNTGGTGGNGGWTVSGTGDSSYNGTYTASGTHNGYDSYTNGSNWLFYNYFAMDSSYEWALYSSVSDCPDPYYCLAYYQYPGNASPNASSWYASSGYSGTPSFAAAASGGGSFANLTKSGGGTLQLVSNEISVCGTLTIGNSTTFDINGQDIALNALSNNGTLKLQGGETTAITTMDTDSGTVEYSGSGIYSSLAAGSSYNDLKINGSGSWTMGADTTINDILNIAAGTFSPGGNTLTLASSGTPLAVSGTLSPNGTITYTGSSATNVAGTTYNNLKINHSGITFTATGDMSVAGVLTIQAGNFNGSNKTITLSGSGTPLVNSDTFTPSTSTVKYTGASNVTVASVPYYNLETNSDDNLVGQSYPLTNGLVGYWKMDESSGTSVADSAGSGNGTAVASDPSIVSGKYGNARQFSGASTANIGIPDSANLNPTSAITISAWINITGGDGSYRTIVSKPTTNSWTDTYASYCMRMNSSNKLEVWINSGADNSDYVTSSSTIMAGSGWKYVTATFDGSTEKVYIGGSADGTPTSYSASISNSSYPLTIGSHNSLSSGEAFYGNIDDVRIYNRALTSSEISNIYSGTSAGIYSPAGNLTVGNNLTMAKGTFTTGANDLSIGNFIQSGGIFTSPASSNTFTVNGGWNHSGGTFTPNSGTVTFAGDALIQGDTTFNNFSATTAGKTLSFVSGSTQTVSGNWTINGSPSNHIILQRSGSSGQWNVNPTSPSIDGVTVSNSNNLAADAISPTNSTNGGGNTNWDFGGGSASISGTVYTAENGSTNIGAGKTIALSINGAAATTVETASDGSYNFANLSIGSGNTIAVYISGETEKGSAITQASNGSSISGVDLYTSHIVLSHQTVGPMTNTLLATVDNVADSDLLVSVSGSNATFTAGNKIWIVASKTYTPGGNVTAGSLEIRATATFTPEANTVTLSDTGTPFTVTGTFNQGASSVIYTGSSAVNVAGTTYHNLTLNHSGTTFTATGSTTVESIFTIQAGTFDAGSQTVTLSGSGTPFVKTGTFTPSTSTIKYTGAGNTNVVSTSYKNLETSPSGTPAGGDAIIVSGAGETDFNGSYSLSGTYGSNNKPAYTDGTHWIFNDFADMPASDYWCMSTSKQDIYEPYMQCNYYSNSTDLPGTWYAGGANQYPPNPNPAPALTVDPAGYVYTFAPGPIYVTGNYTNGDGTHGVKTTADTNDPFLDIDGNFVNSVSATFTASNSSFFSVASNFSDAGHFVHASGTLTLDGQGTQTINSGALSSFNNLNITNTAGPINESGATKIDGTLTLNSGTIYNLNGQNLTLATLSNNGTLKLQGGETTVAISSMDTNSGMVEYTGSGTYALMNAGNSYYDLKISGTGNWTLGADLNANSINETAGTLNASSRTITLSGSGTPLVLSGSFNEGTSTIVYTGSSATNVASTTYDNLVLNHTATTFTAAGDILAKGTLTIQAGNFDASSRTITLSPAGTPLVNNGTFTASTSTVKFTGVGNVTVPALTYNNLETSPSANGVGGWNVDKAGDPGYNGTYLQSGTYGSSNKPAYTNGSYWIFNDYADGPASDYWCMSSSKFDLWAPYMDCPYYAGDANLPGTWYVGESGTAQEPTVTPGDQPSAYTFASGTVNIAGNYTNGDGTHAANIDADANDPTLNIDGNFVNSVNATFTASASAAFSVGSNFTNNNKFVDSSGTITLDGQGLQTVTANGTDSDHDFNNLTITNASANGVSFADSVTTAGTFTDVTASSKVTFHSGSTYAFNAISINGQATGTRVTLTSSAGGSAWNLNITSSSPTASNVSVKDSNANKDIDATTGGYDATGNTHWLFTSAGVTVSGTIYTAENKSTNIGAGKTVALSINGAAATTAETATGGVFQFNEVTVSANQSILIFIDNESEKGSFISVAKDGTTNLTGLELYTSHIILTHETSGAITDDVISNASYADTDSLFSILRPEGMAMRVCFDTGYVVWIISGKTFTPDGDVSAGSMLISGTFSPEGHTVTLYDSGTPFVVSGTFVEGTSTLIYAGSSATNVAGTTYNNLTVNHTGTTFTAAGSTTVKAVFTIQAGTFDASNKTIILSGAGTPLVNSGTFTANTSTIKYAGTSATNITTVPYYNLTLEPSSGSATYSLLASLTSTNAVANNIAIDTGATLDTTSANNYNIELSGSWSNAGTFTPNTSTVTFLGASSQIGASNFYNLTATNTTASAHTTTVTGNLTITGNLSVTTSSTAAETLDCAPNDPNITLTGNLTFAKSSSGVPTLNMGDGTWTVSGNADFRNATVAANASTLVMAGASKTIYGSNPTLYNVKISASTTGYNITVSGTFTIDSSMTYYVASTYTLRMAKDSHLAVNGTLDFGGSYGYVDFIDNASQNLSGTGEMRASARFIAETTDVTVAPRTFTGTYGYGLESYFINNDSSNASHKFTLGTATSQTIKLGNLHVEAQYGGNINVDARDYNPTINVTPIGGILCDGTGAGTEYLYLGNGTWKTISGNVAFASGANTVIAGGSTFVFGYAGTLDPNGQTFNNFTFFSDLTRTMVLAGDLNVAGNMLISAGTSSVSTFDNTVNNKNVTVAGSLTYTGGANKDIFKMGNGTWTVGGDVNLTGMSVTPGNSTLVLNGSAAQTLTTASQSLYNLNVTNASSSGVTFADSTTVTGTFTDTTASSKLIFHALSTYAFANIDINGQASGTKITMVSNDPSNADLPSRQWYFNVSQSSPQASYVNVTDSDANGGNTITPINSTDGGNNENWLFNQAPTNDSLSFSNPYSTNLAVADDTTSWDFQAKVSDPDGGSNLNYVELRLANAADNSSPFDSLKFRWTRDSNSFSEEADTQAAATITSASSDSNLSGNQWTLDFKIKFNSSFTMMNTNYDMELFTLDLANATDTDIYTNIYKVDALTLTLDVDNASIDFMGLLPGSVVTGTTTTMVTCNHPNGYNLSVSDGVSGAFSALRNSDGNTRIVDYSSSISNPSFWSGTGLGITVYEAANKDPKWGTGSTENDSSNKYAGVPQGEAVIRTKYGSPTVNDVTKIGYKIVVPNDQKTGDYSGIITYTATGMLN